MSELSHHHSKRKDEESTAVEHHKASDEADCNIGKLVSGIHGRIHGLKPPAMFHGRRIDHTATNEVVGTIGKPRVRLNALTPPLGTMFHGFRSYTLWDVSVPQVDGKKWGHVRWVVDAYTYASGADPRSSDFAQQGGKIYVVLVTRGYFQVFDGWSSDTWKRITFAINPTNTGLQPVAQLPPTGTGILEGTDYQYAVDFEQRMPLLKNQGNEAFDFDARYKETYGLTLAKQYGSRGGDGIELAIETTKASSAHRYTDIYGLSVFTHTNPRAFPLYLDRYFDVDGNRTWGVWGTWYLHLGFDLE